jgi:DNA-binding response OmpR family regulator
MPEVKKILLIDDEKDFCFFVKQILERSGRFQVGIAHTGETGLTLAQQNKPDLIILDVMMPNMSGPDVADALLRNELLKSVPILFLTALVTEEEIGSRLMREIGGRNFIAKPVEAQKLISCIDNTMRCGDVNCGAMAR